MKFFAALLLLLSATVSVAAESDALRIGVLAYRPKPQTLAQWKPVALYLEHALGRHVAFAAYDHAEMLDAAARRAIDVVVTTPNQFILLQQTAGVSAPLVTLISREGRHELSAFGGAIIARAERADISSLSDLSGRRIAATTYDAFGSFQMQVAEMLEAGLPRPGAASLLLLGQPQDKVVEAVLNGHADAGFVRAGLIESLAHEGKLDLRRLKIVNPQNIPSYPYALSTRLYPEWPVAVMPQVDEKTASHLAAALFLFPRGGTDGIAGFTMPANYDGVEHLLRDLRLPPYELAPRIFLADLWQGYAGWFLALGGLMLLLFVVGGGLVVMYRRSRQAEEEVRRLNQELEQRVSERTAELQAANRELETFTYSVSHDLRQPLRAIDGFLGLLKERLGAALDGESRRYMATISDEALRMANLIDALLSFSRSGRFEMNKTPVDLGELANDVVREFQAATAGRIVEWRIGELPVVNCDRAMLRMVFASLISNAIKFTRPRERALIEIGSRGGKNGEAVIFVKDNGVGFDMKYAKKLFGVFQRLHGMEEFNGAGIGLANVRRVIVRHGGLTWADGKVDGGATFYFSLPQVSGKNVVADRTDERGEQK